MPIYLRGSHGTLHERAPHIFLARPVQPAELVKCVRELLDKELGKLCLEVDIARRLRMDRRSLNRYLSTQGTTFRKIYRQVLLEASQRLLETDASVSDVAEALGFSTRTLERLCRGRKPDDELERRQRDQRDDGQHHAVEAPVVDR